MPPKNKAKSKSPGKDIEVAQNSGLLDAYTDFGPSTPVVKDDSRPVTKKNKNQRKRENAEKMRQLSESENRADTNVEVIDSWEDLEAPVDDETNVPRSIEFPVKEKIETPVPKKEEPVRIEKKSTVVEDPQTDRLMEALAKLQLTMSKTDQLLKLPISKENKSEKQIETTKKIETTEIPKGKDDPMVSKEKSPEEIKAEREAKKKAKAAAKEAAKNKSKDTPTPNKPEPEVNQTKTEVNQTTIQEEKSPEEIKAEREAKKMAKAAAKSAAKNKNKTVDDGDAKPKEIESSKDMPDSSQKTKIEEGKDNISQQQKSKAELKAERRRKQEEQRAKKEEESRKKSEITKKVVKRVPDEIQADRACVEKKLAKKLEKEKIPPRTQAQRKVMLFSHLHQYEREFSLSRSYPVVGAHIHPSIMTLGLQYAEGIITGSNSRCVALLKALTEFIQDYTTPVNTELSRDLNDKLKPQITFLKECRPISVSMGNAIRFLKSKINGLQTLAIPEKEAKEILVESIDEYIHHNIDLAAEQIAITACEKIRDGDVLLTYGCSSLLRKVFTKAVSIGRKFRVIIADGRPNFEGKEMARHMINLGLHCTYVLVSSVPYIIHEVTKVFVGAHAVLANGCVMSRVGTSQVALVAKSHNVPVLVCCETYKFSERVQTDSFVFNELGDPDDLVDTGLKINPLEDWRDLNSLTLLNLSYDVTPANLVDAIISEISVIPGTSVPVVLRLKNVEHVG